MVTLFCSDSMYNRENLLRPIWDTDVMYYESLTFVNGESLLMFEPEEILSLFDSHIQKEFKLGVDFKVEGRRIYLLPDTDIFSFTEDELYPSEPIPGHTFPMGDRNILFYEEHFYHDRQYAVSYRIKENTWKGHRPENQSHLFPATMQKLRNGEPINITLFGDSICVGANASGFTGAEPYLPSFSGLLIEYLEHRYGSKVDFHNPSIGGKDSKWGADTVEENVNFRFNDLVIISLGGNDSFTEPDDYIKNIQTIIDSVRNKHPETEIIVAAPTFANRLLKGSFHGNQPVFIGHMHKLKGERIAVADITSMQTELLEHKRYIDLTGNNVNHPNDFFHRMIAQYFIEMFE
ncbi:MAG: SGNH/GDSL hydrolase family protein [Ruminococcaceae bacterium]|nr:SGNH/GDSL hydrolase family protein [Oscillospiraceae bacterium]